MGQNHLYLWVALPVTQVTHIIGYFDINVSWLLQLLLCQSFCHGKQLLQPTVERVKITITMVQHPVQRMVIVPLLKSCFTTPRVVLPLQKSCFISPKSCFTTPRVVLSVQRVVLPPQRVVLSYSKELFYHSKRSFTTMELFQHPKSQNQRNIL